VRLSKAWKPESGVRVNLGCGFDYREGWINVDRYAERADQRWDILDLPWPLKTGSVDWLYANQILEHVPPRIGDEDGLIRQLWEIHRVLKVGGRCYIGVPHAGSLEDYENITHYRHFVRSSLDFLDPSYQGVKTLTVHSGLRFRLLVRKRLRSLRFTRLFDSSFHLPKYLGFNPNIGRKRALAFVIERLPDDVTASRKAAGKGTRGTRR
jgi:predicted SAM-dependent methyltransferase